MAFVQSQTPLGARAQVMGAYDNATGQQIGSNYNYGGQGYRGPGSMAAPQAQAPTSAWQFSNMPQYKAGSMPSGSAAPSTYSGPASAGGGLGVKVLPNPANNYNLGAAMGVTQQARMSGAGGGGPPVGQPNPFMGSMTMSGGGMGGMPVGAQGGSVNLGQGMPTDLNSLLQMQMGQNNAARQFNLDAYNQAKGNLLGVPGRFDSDPLNQQARTNALQMAQNYQLDPQDAINRASNLVNASSNSRQRALMGELAAAGQLGGSAGFAAQGMAERDRMSRLADVGANIQTEYGQLNFNRGLQATQQAQGLAGQRSGLDFNVANTLMSNPVNYMPEDYSALGRLFAQGGAPGAVGGSMTGSFGGGGGGMPPANSPLAGIMGMISQNRSGSIQGANTPFGPFMTDQKHWDYQQKQAQQAEQAQQQQQLDAQRQQGLQFLFNSIMGQPSKPSPFGSMGAIA